MALHTSPIIEWVDDSLPDLTVVRARGEEFDVVMLTAVWIAPRKSFGSSTGIFVMPRADADPNADAKSADIISDGIKGPW